MPLQHPTREDAKAWGAWLQAPDDAAWGGINSRARELVDAGGPVDPAWRRATDEWLGEQGLLDPEELDLWRTRHWFRVKICARIGARGTCELCEQHPCPEPVVHHLKYSRKRPESLYDVALLCGRCHRHIRWHPARNQALKELRLDDRRGLYGAQQVLYARFAREAAG